MCLMSVTIHIYKTTRNISGKLIPEIDTCSGVFISPTRILTASHCTETGTKIIIKTNSNKTYPAHLIKENMSMDLALIEINKQSKYYTRISSESKISDSVYTVNSGEGFEKTYGTGIIENIIKYESDDDYALILDSIKIMQGASGSGLFNSKGELIGINIATVDVGSLAVNTKEINTFLSHVK